MTRYRADRDGYAHIWIGDCLGGETRTGVTLSALHLPRLAAAPLKDHPDDQGEAAPRFRVRPVWVVVPLRSEPVSYPGLSPPGAAGARCRICCRCCPARRTALPDRSRMQAQAMTPLPAWPWHLAADRLLTWSPPAGSWTPCAASGRCLPEDARRSDRHRASAA